MDLFRHLSKSFSKKQAGQEAPSPVEGVTLEVPCEQAPEGLRPSFRPDLQAPPPPARVSEAEVPAVWQVGDVILDLYEVKQVFTSGGMGLVYRVHHKGWKVDLAVKSPKPEIFAKTGGKENFVREAETWVNLGLHPHIVSCYYVRTLGGIPRVFAEYVEGGSLSDWIRQHKLYEGGPEKALERILDVAIQFAWGLHYAHEQGLVHQDVKPANVLMTPDGIAKVTDFGLARARALAGEAVTPGGGRSILVSWGGMTPAYCSPEQAAGQPLSRKTDIWSWGLSVLEMFVGEVTWLAGQAAPEALASYLEQGLVDGVIPQMPAALAQLLGRCFQQNPADRPANMVEVATTLQEICRRETGQPYPRQAPQTVEQRADSLNNKALSLLDLGREAEAEATWQVALATDPHHAEATYNLGLRQWRMARQPDDELVQQLKAVAATQAGTWRPRYLLGLVHLERGDGAAAEAALKEAAELAPEEREVWETLARLKRVQVGCLRTFEGHRLEVATVAVTPDGCCAVSGSDDKTLRLWELKSGRCLHTLEGHEGHVTAVAVTPDGRYAVSGSDDKTLRLWELKSGRCLHTLEGHERPVNAVAVTPDGRYAVSGSDDKTLRLWELENGRCLRVLERYRAWKLEGGHRVPVSEGHPSGVTAVTVTPDGRYAVSGGCDGTLRLWELESGRCMRTLEGHKDDERVAAVALTPDGRYAVSGSCDKTLRFWDLASGRCLRIFEGHKGWVNAVAVTPDGRFAVSVSGSFDKEEKDCTLRLWELGSGRCLRTFTGHKKRVATVALTPDGRYAVSGGWDGTLRLWGLGTGETVLKEAAQLTVERREVREVLSCLEPVQTVGCLRTYERHWDVTAVALTPDGRYAVSGSEDKTLRLWDLESGDCLCTLEGHADKVIAVAVTSDGHYIVSGSEDKTLRVWALESGCCLRIFEGHADKVNTVAVTPDGCCAVSGSEDKTLRLWELASGRCLRTFEGHEKAVLTAALTPDGRYVVSGSDDKTLRLWDLESGRCLRTFTGHKKRVVTVALTPDGRYAVSGSWDKTLRLWELASGNCLRTLEGHKAWVNAVVVTSDGHYAVSGGWDGTLRLWELESGRCLCTLEGDDVSVNAVAVTPDGHYAISGGQLELQLWDLRGGGAVEGDWALSRPHGALQAVKDISVVRQETEAARMALARGWPTEAGVALRRARAVPGYEWDHTLLGLWHEAGLRGGQRVGILAGHSLHTFVGHETQVSAVAVTPDGRYAISSSWDSTLRLWELESGHCLRTFEGHEKPVLAVAVTPDGRYAVSGGCDHMLRLWELGSGRCLRTFEGHTNNVWAVAITWDGRYAVSGSTDQTLRLWEMESGHCLRTLEGDEVQVAAVALTPDGRYGMSGGSELRLWELASGRCLRTLEGHSWVDAVAVTPDGRYIVSCGLSRLQLGELASGCCLRTLEGHEHAVKAVTVTTDGRYVVSGGQDCTLRVWELASGRCLRTLEGHRGWVNAVAVTTDGRYAVSGSHDNTLRLWELDWDYEFFDPVDWDEGARPYLEIFLTLQTPYGLDGISRVGIPTWTEEDFQQFLTELQYRGYGWLRPEGVRRELEKMAREWQGPPPWPFDLSTS